MPSVGHRTRNQPKERGEADIHQEIKREQSGKELRPCQGNDKNGRDRANQSAKALLFKLVSAEANARYFFAGFAPT